MKNSKKGISLIVLVITIIVIIILAAAVLLSLQNNNPVENANKATIANDASEIRSAVALFIGNYLSKSEGTSPFTKDCTKVTIGTNRDTKLANVTPTTEAEDKLGWDDIGIKKPNTITSVDYDPSTGIFTIIDKNGTTVQ